MEREREFLESVGRSMERAALALEAVTAARIKRDEELSAWMAALLPCILATMPKPPKPRRRRRSSAADVADTGRG